ncbi:MAG: ATP-binding cassette domain-containing protein [Hyphomonadaceae bacterium]|nr:ATP-binding cassette domain-containing protein [Hyphomonadaceae bacterium]
MSGEIAIRLRGIVTRFGEQTVHDGLDLDVRRGEILGVVGPSGCGKSVLLRQIVGLDTPQAGEVQVFGVDVLGLSDEHRRAVNQRMGVMFQDGALFSSLTVRENVEAPFREHTKLPLALVHELAALKLKMAGLDEGAHLKSPGQLSGGMRKRAALARALALDPELLFLDEPTAGLDPVTAGRFDALLRELTDALDLTVFLVTHDLDTLAAVCDRICVLYGGKVAAIGTLDDVRANATGWIADYFSGPRGRAAFREKEV